jgi:3-oxoadipate enol-lactonase
MRHDIDGVRLNVLDEGEGEAVVFLHGLGGCWRDWAPQLDGLRDRYRCVVVEHRGHGRSEATAGAYSTPLFAADVVRVCAALGVERAHVVGLSMGGMIAQHVALDAPDLVDTLVLADTAAAFPPFIVDAFRSYAGTVRDEGHTDSHGVVAEFSPAWSQQVLRDHPEVVRDNQRETEGTDPEVWYRAAIAVAEHDVTARLGDIKAPTLLVWGREDLLVPFDVLSPPLLDGIPDSRLEILDDAGHLSNLDQPEAFNALLTELFNRRGSGQPTA